MGPSSRQLWTQPALHLFIHVKMEINKWTGKLSSRKRKTYVGVCIATVKAEPKKQLPVSTWGTKELHLCYNLLPVHLYHFYLITWICSVMIFCQQYQRLVLNEQQWQLQNNITSVETRILYFRSILSVYAISFSMFNLIISKIWNLSCYMHLYET